MLECVCFVQNVRGCEQETDDIQSFNVVCVCVCVCTITLNKFTIQYRDVVVVDHGFSYVNHNRLL